MCGIAGIVDLSGRPVDRALLRAMTSVQAHRGPDGEGIVCRSGAGLGHRRLAIIDLATGDQPMASDDGAIRIVFNGEIYNFRDLRRDLGRHPALARMNGADGLDQLLPHQRRQLPPRCRPRSRRSSWQR